MSDCAVYTDSHSRCCLVVAVTASYTEFIQNDGVEIELHRQHTAEFNRQHRELSYDVQRAAHKLLNPLSDAIHITGRARARLTIILKEEPMAKKEAPVKTAPEAPKKVAPKAISKTPVPAAEPKGKKAPAAPAPAKPEAKAPKAAAPAAESAGRPHKYGDSTKVTMLSKENPHREGSGRAEAFDALLKCPTCGDYYATGHKSKYLDSWVEAGLVKLA